MTPVAQRMQRVLLAMLALAAGRVVTVAALVDALWGEAAGSRDREQNLHTHVSALRRRLEEAAPGHGGSRVIRMTGGYRLALDPGCLDAQRFESLTEQAADAARGGDAATAAGLFRRALGLWQGAALEDAAPWCTRLAGEAARLEELRARAVEDQLECDLQLGRHGEVVGELARLTSQFPLRERLAGHLMVALWRCGRRGEALAVFDRTRHVLAEELGIDPGPELRALHAKVLADDRSLTAPAGHSARTARSRGNLPAPMAAFVGRDAELSELDKLLGRHRLVTICGPGGVGKTRIAIELAASRADEYRDGVWFVDLAELVDQAGVAGAVASALGIQQVLAKPVEQAIIDRVAAMRGLLVFDNCEHLLDSVAATVERVLQAGPGVRVIATTRQALSLPGEAVWETPPIAYPRGKQVRDPAELAAFDAVRLFIDRIPHQGASLNAADIRSIAEITRRLEGLPLAIELAAARAAQIDLRQLATLLTDRLGQPMMLSRTARGRQQTLDATIGWSYDLLTPQLRSALKRLSVFVGGFTLEAAGAVTDASGSVVEIVVSLAERSLIVADREATATNAPLRYRMLETIRQFCAARIAAEDGPDAEAALRNTHSRYFSDLADRASRVLKSWEQGQWLASLEADHGNLIAAINHLLVQPGRAGDALRMIIDLDRFWIARGHLGECAALLLRGLDAGRQVPPAIRSHALSLAGDAALLRDADAARTYFTECLRIARTADDAAHAALALRGLASACYFTANHEEGSVVGTQSTDLARRLDDPVLLAECLRWLAPHPPDSATRAAIYAELLALTQSSGDRLYVMYAHNDLGSWALVEDDLDTAAEHLDQALAIARELGFSGSAALCNLGWVRLRRMQLDAARAAFAESLLADEAELRRLGESDVILGLACTAAAQGDWERAARTFGFCDREREVCGGEWAEPERTYRETWLSEVKHQLGARFERSYALPGAVDRVDLIDFALGGQHPGGRTVT